MDKYDSILNRHSFAISDPNLHPQTDATYGWIASSNQTTLTLVGEWKEITPVAGVVFATPVGGQTQVTITMYNGEPIYFGAKTLTDITTINSIVHSNWVTFTKHVDNVEINFSNTNDLNTNIKLVNLNGTVMSTTNIFQRTEPVVVSTKNFQHGVFVCVVSDSHQIKAFKFVN
jgi:hypothetical protein